MNEAFFSKKMVAFTNVSGNAVLGKFIMACLYWKEDGERVNPKLPFYASKRVVLNFCLVKVKVILLIKDSSAEM
jgi:hypothetical protein